MRKLLLLLFAAMLAVAGCGDDGGGDVDVASNKTEAEDGDAGADAKEGDEADPEFTGKGGKNFCEYLKDLEENEDELNLSGENNAEQQEKAKKGLEVLEELEDKAPDEIKNDVVVIIKQIKPFFEALAGGEDFKPDPADQPTEVESKEFEASGKRVEAYASNVCGIKDEDAPESGNLEGGGTADEPATEQAPADETPPADE